MSNEIEKGALYVVATPIGNLGDITERAKYVLENVDFVAAEDTRVSGKLLSVLGIKNNFVSYHEHNKNTAGNIVIERLMSGQAGAIVTDAGVPAISDPGEDVVKLCREKDIKVIPIPGACAFVTALSASGMSSRRFVFEGFLPSDKKERQQVLEVVKKDTRTTIFYEAPHRLVKTLEIMKEALGERKICLARELTKLNEEFTYTTFDEALLGFSEKEPRGEYVIILEGANAKNDECFWDNMTVEQHVEFYLQQGMKKMDAIKSCAKDRGVAKNEIYKYFV